MIIKVFETVSQEPNGDRDPNRHPCSKFEVVLHNEDTDKSTIVGVFDQYDPWWTHINGTRAEYLDKALSKAKEMSEALGGVKIEGPDLTNHEKAIVDTEKEIKRLQAKLSDLKAGGRQ